jgi:putative autoinducer-2 (AI-2) aldolase
VKTYHCDGFEKVVAGCPVPVVIAGGKKIEERDALKLAYAAISDGAAGVDMGRNIFQSRWPVQMIRTVRMIVHEGLTDAQAWTEFQKMVG